MKRVPTPSFIRKLRMKSPTGSSPTAVTTSVFKPSRRPPTAIFVGDPPTYAAKDLISTNAALTSLAYRSIDDRPMVIRSRAFSAARITNDGSGGPRQIHGLFEAGAFSIARLTIGTRGSFSRQLFLIHAWTGSSELARD